MLAGATSGSYISLCKFMRYKNWLLFCFTLIRSYKLKASTAECWSIPSINTFNRLLINPRSTLDWCLTDTWSTPQLTLDCRHAVECQSILMSRLTLTPPLTNCQLSVDWVSITGPFNNMRTLKFKVQPTNAFFTTTNQMFGGSSQLPTTAEHCFVVWTVLSDFITACSAVVGHWEERPNIWLTVAKNTFVGCALNFRVHMVLRGTVTVDWVLIKMLIEVLIEVWSRLLIGTQPQMPLVHMILWSTECSKVYLE